MMGFMMFHHWAGPVWTEGHHQFTLVSDYIKSPTLVFIGFEGTLYHFSALKFSQLFLAFLSPHFTIHNINPIEEIFKSTKARAFKYAGCK